jgi:hypothetical protein
MTNGSTTRVAALPRRLARFSLVAFLMTVFLAALPGTASAASVVPLLDCYKANSDGSITVVLGYRSSYTATKTIARGSNNYATPSTYTNKLPTSFKRGEQHGAAILTISQRDLMTPNVSWYLDGNTLNYLNAAQTAGECSAAQLPALASGGPLVVVLLLGGAAGALIVRSGRRAAASTRAPGAPIG